MADAHEKITGYAVLASVPPGEHIITAFPHNGRVYVATQKQIYVLLTGGRLESAAGRFEGGD